MMIKQLSLFALCSLLTLNASQPEHKAAPQAGGDQPRAITPKKRQRNKNLPSLAGYNKRQPKGGSFSQRIVHISTQIQRQRADRTAQKIGANTAHQ
jgi:hypothetical protein